MRELRIAGISRRRKKVFTTRQDPDALRAPDLVKRDFTASAPNQLWVTDLERHEALTNPAVVKEHRLRLVAASRLKLRAA